MAQFANSQTDPCPPNISAPADATYSTTTFASYVLTLPFDIIHAIFLICSAEDTIHFSTTASHVCQSWRLAAIESPALWSTITFDQQQLAWEKYETWLARSRNAPLSIKISRHPFSKSSVKTLGRIFRLILPHTARWLSMAIYEVPKKILRIALDRIRFIPLPILQTLLLSLLYDVSSSWGPTNFIHGTPALRNVSLIWTPINFASSFLSNLLSLKIEDRSNSAARDLRNHLLLLRSLLARSPYLHTLEVFVISNTASTPPRASSSPLIHASIRFLDIHQALVGPLLQEIHAPALVSLQSSQQPVPFPITTLSSFARWPVARNLVIAVFCGTLGARHWDYAEERACLRFLPAALSVLSALEKLEFSAVDFGSDQEDLVCLGSLCPRLKEFVLRGCRGVTMEQIRQVVGVRLRSSDVTVLRTLEISAVTRFLPFPVDDTDRMEMTVMGYEGSTGHLSYNWMYTRHVAVVPN